MIEVIRTLAIILALTLPFTSCAQIQAESTESPSERVGRADRVAFDSLHVLKLQSSQSKPRSLREPRLPSGLMFLRTSAGLLTNADGTTILRGSPEHPIINLEASPSGDHLLVNHASGRFHIYTARGDWVAKIPLVVIEDGEAITWQWRDDRSLVGIAGVSDPVPLPRYPDSDVLPDRTFLFLSRPFDDPSTVYRLHTPDPPPGTVIRIEGVTSEGLVLLGAVEPSAYFSGPAKLNFGLFDLDHL